MAGYAEMIAVDENGFEIGALSSKIRAQNCVAAYSSTPRSVGAVAAMAGPSFKTLKPCNATETPSELRR